jgi:hypothetical protein
MNGRLLHAVAFENFSAAGAQTGSFRLKASLHRAVITEILAAKAGCIARTRGLLLLRAGMLGQRNAIQGNGCQEANS